MLDRPFNRRAFDQRCDRIQVVGQRSQSHSNGFERHAAATGSRIENIDTVRQILRQPFLVRFIRDMAERTRVTIGVGSQPFALAVCDSNALLGRDGIPTDSECIQKFSAIRMCRKQGSKNRRS